ncbi:ParA family protein [Roseiflexus castenholzii]|uniref:ParA family protein n=1 Tax=Roseiflexus castenholzii TaxID=120962 RepID=UPI003C7D5A0E
MSREIFIYSVHAQAIGAAFGAYDVDCVVVPSQRRLQTMLDAGAPPLAVILDDQRLNDAELRAIIHQARGIDVLPIVVSGNPTVRADLEQIGVLCIETANLESGLEQAALRLKIARRLSSSAVYASVAGAKGGIGKSMVVALLAEGLHRRGARVLVVDGDMTNSGLIPEFRIPGSAFVSYLSLRRTSGGGTGFVPERIADVVYEHDSGIHFLLAADDVQIASDISLPEWQMFYQAVQRLHEVGRSYDVVLVDTGPDMKRRPYALHVARSGGWVVLPAPPGRKERQGVGMALQFLAAHEPDLTGRALVIMMEPERGSVVKTDQVAPLIQQSFPRAHIIGRLPRAARLVSATNEYADHYVSPLDVDPGSPFTRAAHEITDAFARTVGLQLSLPMPRAPWVQRVQSWWRERSGRPAMPGVLVNEPLQ